MISLDGIRRVLFGHFTMPDDGDPRAGEKVVVCGYLIDHPDGLVLLDTGIAEGSEEVEELYHPVRRPLDEALTTAGVTIGDIRIVVNCHLHLDHCRGNPRFPGTPIFAQQIEFDTAHREGDYPIVGLYDFADARYELRGGEADVADGIRIVPTPGHTRGHQSVVVETDAGRVVLAGQAVNGATDYGRAQYAARAPAQRLGRDGHRAGLDRTAPGVRSRPGALRARQRDMGAGRLTGLRRS